MEKPAARDRSISDRSEKQDPGYGEYRQVERNESRFRPELYQRIDLLFVCILFLVCLLDCLSLRLCDRLCHYVCLPVSASYCLLVCLLASKIWLFLRMYVSPSVCSCLSVRCLRLGIIREGFQLFCGEQEWCLTASIERPSKVYACRTSMASNGKNQWKRRRPRKTRFITGPNRPTINSRKTSPNQCWAIVITIKLLTFG